jgi:pyruvate kinase
VKEQGGSIIPVSPEDGRINFLEEEVKVRSSGFQDLPDESRGGMWVKPSFQRKTKIVCTIGPTSNTKEMIYKLAAEGMNVARLNMSHGDHASHKKVIDLVREFNKEANANVIALMLDTKGPEVRSGDLPQPIMLKKGDPFTFTIKRGVGTEDCVSVNYDDFVNDVESGDTLLIDGGMMSLEVKSKTHEEVMCEVVDGGELKSRRHLNVRGKSATLPSITEKDWEDIKFGVENKVDFYALSFVKDAQVVHELKAFLKEKSADIHVIVKIESADSIPNLQSILDAADGAMVARGDLGAELPIEEVPLLQGEIIRSCRAMGKPVIVATNMLESMITHPTPTRAEVSDIAIAVREGADAVMLSGETAHGKYPLKAVRVMHTVAMRTEATMPEEEAPANLGRAFKTHMSEMFAFHATLMSNTLGTSICVFTRSGFMALLLSHYRPVGTIFAFTNDKKVQSRLALYHGVRALYIHFTNDAEETFQNALSILQKRGMVQDGEEVALVQSGRQPIWRSEYTHHIQVRKVRA